MTAAKPEETAGEGRSTRVPGRSIRILISSVPDPQKKADRKGRTKGKRKASHSEAGPEESRPEEIQKAGPKSCE